MISRAILLSLLSVLCIAETHRVTATKFYNSFHHRHPVLLKIKPGDTVVTRTIDASGRDDKGEVVGEPSNPLTGPFYIEGAAPDDAIAVTFSRIRMNRSWGYTAYRLGLFSLTPGAIETLYPNRYKEGTVIPGRSNVVPWDLDLTKSTVRLREPRSMAHPMEFPARPMLGCVGVAAAADFGPNSGISGPYGGNMDYNEVAEGATVVLPVFHPGALLFLGDGHALQADGEPTGTGIETSMDVEFTVALRKAAKLSNPRLETADYIASIGSQPEFASPLDRALQIATSDMAQWLASEYTLEPWAAHLLIGYQGKYDVVTVAGSVALRMARKWLPPSR
jgi:acetamidase/formamidase